MFYLLTYLLTYLLQPSLWDIWESAGPACPDCYRSA